MAKVLKMVKFMSWYRGGDHKTALRVIEEAERDIRDTLEGSEEPCAMKASK